MIQSEHHDSLDRIRVNAKTLPYGAENCWNNWDGCYEAAAYNHILIFGFCRIKESLKWIDLKMEKNEIQHSEFRIIKYVYENHLKIFIELYSLFQPRGLISNSMIIQIKST